MCSLMRIIPLVNETRLELIARVSSCVSWGQKAATLAPRLGMPFHISWPRSTIFLNVGSIFPISPSLSLRLGRLGCQSSTTAVTSISMSRLSQARFATWTIV